MSAIEYTIRRQVFTIFGANGCPISRILVLAAGVLLVAIEGRQQGE